ncbi:PREDICTED: transcription and mRNA export factor ENY2 isoform X1 [Haliaeetus leucocephalus]|uniref:transcription and mRNA export factor ENY2 isoform X1 n=1 Tax=Haliaeetus leucocephalus TaxID=52644 RepID=UPI000522C310|nr:PREDICTED: transcription and mRNA export factor ENY2 isoform X1 [Haliaeetus albicilla]XP_010575287.1 PREDICTED: transcription and mRNA export factor ENY2 isoform X1 [Haliaeetus leucocephalus]
MVSVLYFFPGCDVPSEIAQSFSRASNFLKCLKELLRAKLIECGWKDQLKAHCKDVIKEKGLEHVTVDDLVAEITPKGRALVPDSVKKELLQRIRTFLAQHASL